MKTGNTLVLYVFPQISAQYDIYGSANEQYNKYTEPFRLIRDLLYRL